MTSSAWKWSLSSITGLAALIIYSIFTFTAVALYPAPYNPLYDWLSNLGNVNFNPAGAVFFNSGCILTGIILVPFFAGLYRWYEPVRWKKILLLAGQVIGIFAGVALIMVGVFPETQIASHMLAKIAQGENEELDLLYEDLEVKIFEVHKRFGMERKTLGSLDIPGRFGCGIVAIKRDDKANSGIDMNKVLKQGDYVAIIGSPERIVAFARAYDRKLALRWISKQKQRNFFGF